MKKLFGCKNKKGNSETESPSDFEMKRLLLYYKFLCVYCVSADDSDVVNAACVVACVEFVCAFAHLIAQNYAS